MECASFFLFFLLLPTLFRFLEHFAFEFGLYEEHDNNIFHKCCLYERINFKNAVDLCISIHLLLSIVTIIRRI